ncbi:NUDIX domain-containing protein [Shimazuella kribbensis]|uniref:NUDIX domain-containing protein n=1 Tax=Shimazuella kribbensis TaxID=139808 RepID=UPI00040C9A36|nr:NUDIX domain-containing protein [Shimazuella kribbensis]
MGRKDYYHEDGAPKPNSIVPAASAVVIDDKNRILLQKRRDNNLWSLPGGGMELGESIEETIVREVMEETGFNVEVVKCIGIYTDPKHVIEYSDGEIRQQFSICFACQIIDGSMQVSSESKEVEFISLDQLENLEMHPAQRVRINDYLEYKEMTFIR